MKSAKLLIFWLSATLLFLVGGIFLIISNIDLNEHKPAIEQEISQRLRLPVTINGPIKLHWLPALSIRVKEITIGKKGHGVKPTVLRSLSATISWLPLLKKQLIIRHIKLSGLEAQLATWQQRTSNSQTTSTSTKPKEQVKQGSNQNKSPVHLSQFNLSDSIFFISNKNRPNIKINTLDASDIQQQHPFPLHSQGVLQTAINGNQQQLPFSFDGQVNFPIDKTKQTLSGQIKVNKANIARLNFAHCQANLKLDPKQFFISTQQCRLNDGTLDAKITYQLPAKTASIKLAAENLQLRPASKEQANLSLTGRLSGKFNGRTQDTVAKNRLFSLNGQGDIKVENGQLSHLDIASAVNWLAQMIANRQGADLLRLASHQFKESPSYSQGPSHFDLLTMHFAIKQQLVQISEIKMTSKHYQLSADAGIDLKQQHIDAMIQLKLLTPSKHLAKLQKKLGGSIPMHLVGSLTQPKLSVALSMILKKLGTHYLNNNARQLNFELRKGLNRLTNKLNELQQ